ncbi:FecCD family ABC transporter permease [Methanomassiliicoccus luminyensis]|uniref:FecCD family ABC transporter permease n=1 Tax=Methanomassiliicoccus luminyensis TaxID=1080712 RepID=UPI001F446074|nr:iron ABC transporter permease [Methanomassiliicoccus luminyensis]
MNYPQHHVRADEASAAQEGPEVSGKVANAGGHDGMKSEYHRYTERKILFITACIIAAFLLLGISICIGAAGIDFWEAYDLLFKHLAGTTYDMGTVPFIHDYVIWNVRLPRALFALVGGAGLAVGGAVMQSVMRNPLADPYTTGISSGALLGVAVAIILGLTVSGSHLNDVGLVVNAFIFALIPMAFIMVIAPMSNSSPATLILAGVTVSYIFNALTTVLMISTDAEELAIVYRWQVGSLSMITWNSLPIMVIANIAGAVAVMVVARQLNVLALGDDNAKSLGLNANNMRVLCVMITSFMVASVISCVGIIGFIGLICPHIIRILIDSDNRFVIPASAALGGVFLLGADILARCLSPIDAIPVGVILSFVGAPIFLYLIIRQKKAMW